MERPLMGTAAIERTHGVSPSLGAGTRVALYTRTSTNDGRQDHDNQLFLLRQFAAGMKWTVAAEFADSHSGAYDRRPGLEALMRKAARRGFDVVLVFDLSRLTRGGPAKAFEYISRLATSRVEFWSMTEEHFRTSGVAGSLLIAIAAHIAEQERTTMQHRIKAGMDRARRAGKRVGRPFASLDRDKVKKMRAQGKSIRDIAGATGVSRSTIEREVRGMKT
jgi:DNA invertase Pin-like site-specific DNA recombinase